MDERKLVKIITNNKSMIFLTEVFTIIGVFIIYLLNDYVRFGGTMEFVKDGEYWTVTSISLCLIVILMITVRNMHKTKLVSKNKYIADNMYLIDASRRVILNDNYGDKLDEYLIIENENNKYDTYISKITKKINRWQAFSFIIPQKLHNKKLRELEAKLKLDKSKVISEVHVRYKPVTQAGLYAGIDGKITVYNAYDTNTHNVRDIVAMSTTKCIFTVALMAFTGTLTTELIFGGWTAIWSTIVKIFVAVLSISMALRVADDFVTYNIPQALDNRVRILTNFISKHPELKMAIVSKKNELEKDIKIEKRIKLGAIVSGNIEPGLRLRVRR